MKKRDTKKVMKLFILSKLIYVYKCLKCVWMCEYFVLTCKWNLIKAYEVEKDEKKHISWNKPSRNEW